MLNRSSDAIYHSRLVESVSPPTTAAVQALLAAHNVFNNTTAGRTVASTVRFNAPLRCDCLTHADLTRQARNL